MSEWSVLVTSLLGSSTPAIDDHQISIVLDMLPGDEKWIQYPPASGRGHGFETRFWWEADAQADAATAGADALRRYQVAIGQAGLRDVRVVFVHVTSPGERLTEGPIGLERRRGAPTEDRSWHVMLRSVCASASADPTFPASSLDRLLIMLGPDSIGTGRDGMVEVRFWVEADDAVDASGIGSARFGRAMATLGKADWTTVRDHATSVAEAARVAYLGVERRALVADPTILPVRLNPASVT